MLDIVLLRGVVPSPSCSITFAKVFLGLCLWGQEGSSCASLSSQCPPSLARHS